MTTQRVLTGTYAAVSWLMATLAVLHMATTWRLSSATAFTKVWFFGAGIAMAQVAALNLLNRAHRRSFASLAWVTRGSNALVFAFAVVGGVVTKATLGELIVILGAFAALLVLSFSSAATRPD